MVTIALGIAATTSIYGIVDGVLLRPLPFRDPGRLVQVRQIFTKWKGNPVLNYVWDKIPLGVDEFERLRDRNTVFSSVGIWSSRSRFITGRGKADRARVTLASSTLLEVLNVRPIRGRGIDPGEDVVGGPKVAVVGYDEWQRRFGGTDSVLGQSVVLGETPYRIVGVLPRTFRIELQDAPMDYIVPVGQDSTDRGHENRSYRAVARLKPGVTVARAELETKQILDDPHTNQGNKTARLADWHVEQTRDTRTPLFILLAAVALLMVIACVNVATLMLGEATAREHEMAARVALGAGRMRIIRQLLTESLLLSVTGSAVGALLAIWGTKMLIAIAPPRIPGLHDVHVDQRVLGFAAVVSVVTGVVFGLAPAMALSGLAPASLMRGGGGQSVAGRGRLQFLFVAVQFGLSVVLLVGAGLLSRSLLRMTEVDPGFRADHLIVARISTPGSMPFRDLYRETAARLAALPGVTAVSSASAVPFDGGNSSTSITLPGQVLASGQHGPEVQERTVFPGYFEFMSIPIIAGRSFNAGDRAESEPVVIISAATARRDFPNGHAEGARVQFQGVTRTIVGVARDVKFRGLSLDPEPTLYAPFEQRTSTGPFLIRTTLPPKSVMASVRAAITEVDSRATVTQIDAMDDLVRQSFAEERFRTTLVSLFGVLAALLAAIGMYGVASRAVARRTREVGIRVALGAQYSNVIALIVRSTLGGVTAGVITGVVIALIGARWAQTLLFEVSARDPVIYGVIVVFLGAVALLASWVPARRAARVHPAMVLRGD
jgi:predicted permease